MSESNRRKFLYRGKDLEQLRKMSMKEFIQLVPSRQRRTLRRSMNGRQKKLLKKLKKARKAAKNDREIVVRTHNRDMIIFPEFI
ncbi:MAG: ribosomal protein S19 family protein, partial [Promethearchaeota archaeon]